MVVVLTLTFEAMLFGASLAEQSFPPLEDPTPEPDPACSGVVGCIVDFFEDTVDFLKSVFTILVNILKTIYGSIVFLLNLISFNVPGAPTYIRWPVGFAIGGALTYSLVGLLRGVKT